MLSKMMTNDFPARWPLTLCLILKRTSPGHASGFCAASRFWRPCQPSAADAVEDDRRIFREGYNYNREFASRRDGIMLLAARPLPLPGSRRNQGGRVGEGMATVK